jgi:hypothetical protein
VGRAGARAEDDPGLENAEFVRFGMIHRNTYVNAPTVLHETWQTRMRPDLFFAGQMSGVEGYVESAASGLIAGRNAAALALGEEPSAPPRTTAIGALAYYAVARRSETLRAVEHRLRPDPAARAAGEEQEGSQHRDFRARAHGFGRLVRDHLKAFLEHLRLNENASRTRYAPTRATSRSTWPSLPRTSTAASRS